MKEQLEEIVKILEKVPESYIELNRPASKEDIEAFEKKWNITLPSDYVELLMMHNGIGLMGAVLLGVPLKDETCFSLESAYEFEHFQVYNPMPLHLVPFSPDGGGNYYCFDILNNNIVFWDSEYDYSNDEPEIVYNSLAEMIREVFIEWTLEDIV